MSRAYDAETAHLREMERWRRFNTIRGLILSMSVCGMFIEMGQRVCVSESPLVPGRRSPIRIDPRPQLPGSDAGTGRTSKKIGHRISEIKAVLDVFNPVPVESPNDSSIIGAGNPDTSRLDPDGSGSDPLEPPGGRGSGSAWSFELGVEILPVAGFQPKPEYPDDARRIGLEGNVEVEVTVEPDGSVSRVLIARSDNWMFDQASLSAARLWKFSPAKMHGTPVRVSVKIPFTFRLTR